ncbi:uncharacterized protein LOC132786650 [Drosophila nasuta]|uniref:uncharacterized protein LOC132786650 n=1 Tax=Drosophila nasuta TaxID=42062 RepID=UPI00295EE310|nr:uncharacterized protein LOC132786650 [Drosophila nasuta]
MRRSCPKFNLMADQSSSDAQELTDNLDDKDVTFNCNVEGGKQDVFDDDPELNTKSVRSNNASDDSDASMYNRCWERAQHYVHEFIKKQDDNLSEDTNSKASSCRENIEVSKKEQLKKSFQKMNCTRCSHETDTGNHSDTELSQLSPSSSEESKTYSQVYSEILEESKARQKKAEKICRVYNHNNERTMRWVKKIGQYDDDDSTTDASERSDKDAEDNCAQSEHDIDYESLIKEQLDVIAQYQSDPLATFRNCMKEYISDIDEARIFEKNTLMNTKQLDSPKLSARSKHCTQQLVSENETSKLKVAKIIGENETEILQFEHCEIYHVKKSNRNKDMSNWHENKSDTFLSFPTKEVSPKSKSPKEIVEPSSNYIDHSAEFKDQSEMRNDKKSEYQHLEANSSEMSLKYNDDCYKQVSERSESSDESETSLRSFLLKDEQESHRTRGPKKSDGTSNNSRKSQHLPTTSSRNSEAHSSYDNSSDSTKNYCVSSKSSTSYCSEINSNRSHKRISKDIASKSYENRACSPIKVKLTPRRANQMICKQIEAIDDYGDDADYIEYPSEVKLQHSQASITSEDKGIQYPSEDEEDPLRYKTKRIDDLKGDAIVYDNKDELLDISPSDTETQMQAKLQSPVSSDGKKENSSRNSSYNSIRSADISSICSISSYEPSERFFRRTKAEDDDDNCITDDDDSEPMSYKKHVARLAERALRACTNYYSECIKLKPDLDRELNKKVEMIYNSEMRFNSSKR